MLDEDYHVSTIHNPSNYTNGNTFDYQGRQISCEHLTRRVTRYEYDGTVTVLADKFNGKKFNAPNDVVVHPDGGIWFTDPGYGTQGNYEGEKAPHELKEAVYRIDGKTGKVEKMFDDITKPNGLCFSPDYKKLYVADTDGTKEIRVYDIVDGKKATNGRVFASMKMTMKDGTEASGVADGLRCDVEGNVWGAGGSLRSALTSVLAASSETSCTSPQANPSIWSMSRPRAHIFVDPPSNGGRLLRMGGKSPGGV
jgi:gluconolactonase